MKIAMLRGPRDLRIEEQPLDTSNLQPHEIWVETRISAFKIGTDRGNYEGAEQVPGAPDYPRWVGDSNLGVVRGVGRAVKRVQVGDRIVTRAPHQSEYITTEQASLVKIPDGVHDEDAVYAHLYALSAHCYHKAQFRPGETVAVVGLGWARWRLVPALGRASLVLATARCVWRCRQRWEHTPIFSTTTPISRQVGRIYGWPGH
ncbi:MAG: hypothetical protein R2867_25535 [Caldilineaceae bacterium]